MIEIKFKDTGLYDIFINGTFEKKSEYGCFANILKEVPELYNTIQCCSSIFDLESFPWLDFKLDDKHKTGSVLIGNTKSRLCFAIDSPYSISFVSLLKEQKNGGLN